MNKTMLKLVWSLTIIVLLAGVVRLATVLNDKQTPDQKSLVQKAK